MKRAEAIMAHIRDTAFGLPRIPGHRLAWLVALPLLILTLPAQSSGLDEAPPDTGTPTAAIAASSTGTPADPTVTPAAVIVTPAAEAKPQSDDRRRRVLMLLLMNSAGPVRPYGNLGR